MDLDHSETRLRELLGAISTALGVASNRDFVGLSALGDPRELQPLADDLAVRGWLRRGPVDDAYALAEDGKLELAAPLDVTLYTRPGCHLCDEAKAQIAPLLRRAGARLRQVNIDDDEVLRERYNVDVPVLFLGARRVAKHRVDLTQFERQLAEAARGGA
jgi:glutaredoxin